MNFANLARHPGPYIDLGLFRAAQRFYGFFRLYLLRIELEARQREALSLSAEEAEWVSTLRRDGIVVIPNFVSPADCAAMMAETEARVAEAEAGKPQADDGVKYFNLGEHRTAKAFSLDRISPTGTRVLLKDARLHRVAVAYNRAAAPVAGSFVERKRYSSDIDQLETWHFDGVDKRFKAFLYLTDTSERNGAFEYMVGSHHYDRWKTRRMYRWHKQRNSGQRGATLFDATHFLADEEPEIMRRYRRLTVTGPAGTMFLFDARGIHRGLTLKEGTRYIAQAGFRAKNF